MKRLKYEYDNGFDWNIDCTSSNGLTYDESITKKIKQEWTNGERNNEKMWTIVKNGEQIMRK